MELCKLCHKELKGELIIEVSLNNRGPIRTCVPCASRFCSRVPALLPKEKVVELEPEGPFRGGSSFGIG